MIQPPVQDFYTTGVRIQPLGLAYLKAALLQKFPHITVKIVDHHGGKRRRSVPLPPELSHLRRLYADDDRSVFSSFFQFYHFGSSMEEIARDAKGFEPDLVGISSLFSAYMDQVLLTAEAIKSVCDAPVVCGGGHATVHPESLLESPHIDFVLAGEGEEGLIRLVGQLLERKSVDRMDLEPGRSSMWMDLVPDFSDFPLEAYLYEKKPLAFIQVSRGCPADCSFCSIHPISGKRHRRRSIDSVIGEMEIRYAAGYRIFDFEDDNLTFSRSYSLQLFQRIRETFAGRGIRLLAMNGVYFPTLDGEILAAMKGAGFSDLNLSFVSQNREELQKHSRVSIDSVLSSLEALASMPVLLGVSPFYATPGMELTREIQFRRETLMRGRLTAMEPADAFHREDLHAIFVSVRILNFLKSAPVGTTGLCGAMGALSLRDQKSREGVNILDHYFKTGMFCTLDHTGKLVPRRGLSSLLDRILSRIRIIRGREGQEIHFPPIRDTGLSSNACSDGYKI